MATKQLGISDYNKKGPRDGGRFSENIAQLQNIRIGVCPMTYGGYFVSDEAEKAAKWDALEEFRELKRHRDTITDAMSKTGKALGDFAHVLQHREGCTFDLQPSGITVGRERSAVAHIDSTQFDWQAVSSLIADYIATTRRIAELEPRFRDLS